LNLLRELWDLQLCMSQVSSSHVVRSVRKSMNLAEYYGPGRTVKGPYVLTSVVLGVETFENQDTMKAIKLLYR